MSDIVDVISGLHWLYCLIISLMFSGIIWWTELFLSHRIWISGHFFRFSWPTAGRLCCHATGSDICLTHGSAHWIDQSQATRSLFSKNVLKTVTTLNTLLFCNRQMGPNYIWRMNWRMKKYPPQYKDALDWHACSTRSHLLISWIWPGSRVIVFQCAIGWYFYAL